MHFSDTCTFRLTPMLTRSTLIKKHSIYKFNRTSWKP